MSGGQLQQYHKLRDVAGICNLNNYNHYNYNYYNHHHDRFNYHIYNNNHNSNNFSIIWCFFNSGGSSNGSCGGDNFVISDNISDYNDVNINCGSRSHVLVGG